ncbi:hypothetical protein [Shewanella sp. c952]|uniref:hypothetical protein n=1 Tax=Shewanella sp. c952 TaxID=2815913 RepID=UPI001C7DEDF3|nr:hypothetical protein [Shewanella sp. c952]
MHRKSAYMESSLMGSKGIKSLLIAGMTLVLLGCQSTENKETSIRFEGFIGFKQAKPWAITFNDCTVYRFSDAKPYYWFDRSLNKVSCYQFSETDKSELLGLFNKIYQMPSLTAPAKSFIRFEQLDISSSGWGAFPKVFDRQGEHWIRVKEGWIYLQKADFALIEVYQGQQDMKLKANHDSYYNNH